ncbi:MAG: TonB-dependent receptor [Hyphococcus sp.]|nr:MAG: TonB-dependent receptor [Marinicaulis sp.]
MLRKPVSIAASGMLVACYGAVALAQDTIIVTSERRAQSADEVVGSISALSGEEIKTLSADHIAEALARAPGVNLHRGSGADHLTAIRSPVLTGGAGAGSFLFLENGVPIRSPGFANINGLIDAHHEIAGGVEIVRGPSGALYGANAIHGVINVLTPRPGVDLSAFSEVFGDSEDRYKWKAAISDTTGAHGFFVGASIVSEGGYRESAGLDQQKLTARHLYTGADIEIDTIFSFNNLEQETAGFIFGADTLLDRDLRRTNDFPDAYRDAQSVRLQSIISVDLSSQSQFKITPYARWNEMEFPQHFLPSNALENNSHWSVGAQTAYYYDAGAFSFIAGIDLEYTEGKLREFQERPRIFSFSQGLHYDYEVRALNASGFVHGEYKLSDDTILSAALRIDGTVYDYDNRTNDGIVGRFLRLPDQTSKFVTASPKFSVRHQFSEELNAYASYSRGARPPQTTDLYRLQINQTGDQARPETIDAVEAGLRAELAYAVQVNIATFWMEKKNFFFRDADGFNVANGKTRHVGAEAEISIQLHETLSLESALTYAAHTYRFDRATGRASESIAKGDDVDSAPRVIANTRLAWRPINGALIEAEWISLGSYFTDAANDHAYDGHNLLHLRGELGIAGDLSGFITLRNVTDSLYAERADFAFGRERFFPGEGRTLGLGLRYQR